MPTARTIKARTPVRLARSSPFTDTSDAETRRKLRALAPRGRCAAVAAAASLNRSAGIYERGVAAAHAACPPHVRVLLQTDRAVKDPPSPSAGLAVAAGRGVAGWAHRCAGIGSVLGRRYLLDPIHAAGMRRVAVSGYRSYRAQLACSQALPIGLIVALAADPGGEVRCGVAKNPAVPAPLLAALATDPRWSVRREVAANRRCPAGRLAELGRDRHTAVRWAVAANPSTPSGTLATLIADTDEATAGLALDNPSCVPEVFAVGAAHASVETRRRIARHKNCPPEALVVLANDPDPDLRSAAAGNPKCPPSEHQMLLSDHDELVRAHARNAVRT